ncbi:FecR domain-containing protein [Rhodobacteraceae bacterium NNCM2]|nr:FecR domain-containing protein [Coraliihabitans acroporae]
MTRTGMRFLAVIAAVLFTAGPLLAADEIGQVKLVKGDVSIERGGQSIVAEAGTPVEKLDILRTGSDSAVGLTFNDNSRMSLGPNSELALETYVFNGQGDAGNSFDARLTKGSMTAASGLIAKTPDAMRVLMPTTILGVRGTEFAVRVGEE